MTTRPAEIVRRTCRRAGLDRNPLRRSEDRWQSGAAMLCVLVLLIAVPLAVLFVGRPVYAAETRAVQVETARLHKVDATVTEVGKTPLYAPVTPVTVRWRAPDGTEHTGDYHSDVLVKNGATVSIWLDDSNRIVEPPAGTRPLSRSVLTSAGALTAVLICCGGGYLALRYLLDRRRARLWESEWATAGLTWGGRAS